MTTRLVGTAVFASLLVVLGALTGCGESDVAEAPDVPETVSAGPLFEGETPTQIAMGVDQDSVRVAGLVEGGVVTATCDAAASCESTPGPTLAGEYGLSFGFAGNDENVDLVHVLTCAAAIDPCPDEQLALEVFNARDGYSNVATIGLAEFNINARDSVVGAVIPNPGTAVLSVADGGSMTTTLFRVGIDEGTVTSTTVDGGVVAMAPSSDGSVVMATKKVARYSSIGGGQDSLPADTDSTAPPLSAPAELPGNGEVSDVFESGERNGTPPAEMKILRLDASDGIEEARTLPEGSDDVAFIATQDGLGLIQPGSDVVLNAETNRPIGDTGTSRPAPEATTISTNFCGGSVPGAVLVDFTQRLATPQSTAMQLTFSSEDQFVSESIEREGIVSPEAACAVGARLFLVVTTLPAIQSAPATPESGGQAPKLELVIL